MNTHVVTIDFDDHPSLQGHFPGNPVMPGVVLLENVLMACKEWEPEHQTVGLQSVKFHSPIRPGDTITIELERKNQNKTHFRCIVEKQVVSTGVIIWQARHE
jgi:3-hydroxymyristoyl/3-hydroxydecanoyl-(acyl carrier protein) dehydratase